MANPSELGLAQVADAIGHPARAAMLGALLGGEALPAGELARRAGVSSATGSEHLARLVGNGLVRVRPSGRHRYYGLASGDVAAALEALARITPLPAAAPRRDSRQDDALRAARTCYDHLAGALGVQLTVGLTEAGIISDGCLDVTADGEAWLGRLSIDVAALRTSRRRLVRPCLDWSERRDHLAGAVGAALTSVMLERRWLARLPGTRAVRLTLRGREGLYRAFGRDLELVLGAGLLHR